MRMLEFLSDTAFFESVLLDTISYFVIFKKVLIFTEIVLKTINYAVEKIFLKVNVKFTPSKSLKRALLRKLIPAKSLVKLNSRKSIPAKSSIKPNLRKSIPAKCPKKRFARINSRKNFFH